MDPPSNSAKAKAWARARARVETRPRANARARVRDRIRARATELGLEGGNNFRGVQIKRDTPGGLAMVWACAYAHASSGLHCCKSKLTQNGHQIHIVLPSKAQRAHYHLLGDLPAF